MNVRTILLALLLLANVPAIAQDGPEGAPAVIQAIAGQAAGAAAATPGPYDERRWLERFYAPRGYAAAWPARQASTALSLLDHAEADGLDPHDYRVAELRRAQSDPGFDRGAFDCALTAAMLHYLADLRVGRVRSEYHTTLPDPRLDQFDPVERLRAALAGNDLAGAVKAAQPAFPLYGRVKATLARYRTLSDQPQPPLPPPAGGKAAPGAHYGAAGALRDRLVLLGDLPPDAEAPGATYTAALAGGVRGFQARHALDQDGVLGPATLAALNVPLARRVRQLELTLERLRWLPGFAPGPVVAVNIPAYRLWAFTLPGGGEPLEMAVIVGAAVETPTPLFIGQMRYVEFNPYWNVPRSITLKEIIPKLEHDPRYLAHEQMELVPAAGGQPVRALTASLLDGLRAGSYRVRQRPGPKNSLGAIKFGMPNAMDIYLHATPARELFRRSRRDLSHGCIRVEQPVALAEFVLRDPVKWNARAIEAAMAPGPTRRVALPALVPVVLFYATAITDREGRALFLHDVYGRDPMLEQALAGHAHLNVPTLPGPNE